MIHPPEYSSLIDPLRCAAFAMRFVKRVDLEVPFTFEPLGSDPTHPRVKLFHHVTKTGVTDATMFISPFVTFSTPMTPELAAQMFLIRLTVEIDEEKVVDAEPLRHFMVLPPFERSKVKVDKVWVGRNEDSLLGGSRLQFLPNGSIISAYIDRVPTYAPAVGVICLTVGAILALYTTKVKQGVLMDVGALDDQMNAVQVARTWGSTDPLADVHAEAHRLAEIRIEETIKYGAAAGIKLTGAEEEAVRERKRLREDADLLEKTEKARTKAEAADEDSEDEDYEVDVGDLLGANIDKTLARATRRLVRVALVATLVLVSAAAAVIYFADVPFFDIFKR